MTQREHDLLTVQEVSEMLRLHEITVRRMIADGDLPSVTVGKRGRRIERAELDRYLHRSQEREEM